jgi:tetratricopeptide (TPR) repeat protein
MSSGFLSQIQNAVSFVLLLIFSTGMLFVAGCESDETRVENFIAWGQDYVANDQPEEAIIEFRNVLQIEPENAIAHEALSLAYLKVEKPREAYWEMSETVRLDPGNVAARIRYGTVSIAISDFDLAFEQAEAVLQIDPSSSVGFLLRGRSQEGKENFDAAEADLLSAIESSSMGAAYRLILSEFYMRRGDREGSENILRELIEIEESYLAVSRLSRLVASARGRDDEALVLLERSVELALEAPKGEAEELLLGEDFTRTSLIPNVTREQAVPAAYVLLAAFHFDRGRFEKSIEVLEEGVSQNEKKVDLIYQLASFYRRKGMPSDEKEQIRRATREAPDSSSAQLVLSSYLGGQGDHDGALEAAHAAVMLDPRNRLAQLREAEMLVDIGHRESDIDRIAAGQEIVDGILREEPENPEANFVRAKIELTKENLTAAQELLETVVQVRPNWPQARYVLGSVLMASKDFGRARVELARAIEGDPNLSGARKLLVKLHAKRGEHEFAIELGREALQKHPGDIETRITVGQSLIQIGRREEAYAEIARIPVEHRNAAVLFALGTLDVSFGRLEQGADRLRRSSELVPDNPQVLRALLRLDRAGDSLAESAARIARAVEANPNDSELAEIEAEIKHSTGDEAGARAALKRAISLEARNVTAQIALAELEGRSGNIEGMIAVIERAEASVPESSMLKYRLALAYESNGQTKEAIDAYERAISLNPDLAIAKNNLAYLLTESGGDLDRALELAQQAKEQLPEDANSADTLGWVLLKRGVPSVAIGYLEEAAERFPIEAAEAQGMVRNHLAEAYEKNAEVAKAIGESRKSVEYFDKLDQIAKQRGIEFEEPDWTLEARARIARLADAS